MIVDGTTLTEAIRIGQIIAYQTPENGPEVQLVDSQLHVGPNSIDVTLGHELLCPSHTGILDPRDPASLTYSKCHAVDTPNGKAYMVFPGKVYLGFAAERFYIRGLIRGEQVVQMLDGRSTVGRIGIAVHVTAGFGDVGFVGNFTLEIVNFNAVPVLLYPGMRIGQVAFHTVMASEQQLFYAGAYASSHVGRPVPPVLGKDRF